MVLVLILPHHSRDYHFESSRDNHHLQTYPVIVTFIDNFSDFIRVFAILLHIPAELASLSLLYYLGCVEFTRMLTSEGSVFGFLKHQFHADLYFSEMFRRVVLAGKVGSASLPSHYRLVRPPAFLLNSLFQPASLACVSMPSSTDCLPTLLSLSLVA